MKKIKTLLISFACIAGTAVFSQVGINTVIPKTTLDVSAAKTDGTTAEGIIAPRLTGDQIKAKDAKYLTAQTGAIVYITAAVTTGSAKTANINSVGYYYFDGNIWQKVTKPTISFTATLGNGFGGSHDIVASGFFTTIKLPDVAVNLGGGTWDSVNYTYAVPISGTYIIKSSIRLTDATANDARNIFQAVGTTNADNPDGVWQTNSGNRWTMMYTRIAHFNEGDLLRLYIYSSDKDADLSNASLNIALLSNE